MDKQFFKVIYAKRSTDAESIQEQAKLLSMLCNITIVFTVLSAALELFNQSYDTLYVHVGLFLCSVLARMLIKLGTRNSVVEHFYLISYLGSFLYMLLSGTGDYTFSLWLLIIPFAASYICGFRRSLPYLVAAGIIVSLWFYTPLNVNIQTYYNDQYRIIFPILYWAELAVVFLTLHDMSTASSRRLETSEKKRNAVYEERERASEVSLKTIVTISSTIDAKDEYTNEHSERVAHYAEMIAREMKFPSSEVKKIHDMAMLHDIGKVGIPDSVLKKPGRLDDDEFSIIKRHTTIGASILHDLSIVPEAEYGAHFHHEHYDGSGYPLGLVGAEIPIEARIICVADSFDAMNSKRVYRKKCDKNYIRNEIMKGRGHQFDPEVADVFLGILNRAWPD